MRENDACNLINFDIWFPAVYLEEAEDEYIVLSYQQLHFRGMIY